MNERWAGPVSEYLTTKELAEMLRIKERKVYDLAASGDVPCSKAMGKLLFPRAAIEAWLAANSTGGATAYSTPHQPAPALPNIFLGSHDPLLDWALRESQCGIATFFDGSADGLARFADNGGIATGLHLFDPADRSWNKNQVREACGARPVVLVEWARRQRGLIVGPVLKNKVTGLQDLKGRRVTSRQSGSGTQILFDHLLLAADLKHEDVELTTPARTEVDAALSVLEEKADAAVGLACIAAQFRLPFLPVIEERFDLLVDRRAWFEPAMQTLFAFCRSKAFVARARELAGYDLSGFGQVHFNGP